jgi:hypothetical protein
LCNLTCSSHDQICDLSRGAISTHRSTDNHTFNSKHNFWVGVKCAVELSLSSRIEAVTLQPHRRSNCKPATSCHALRSPRQLDNFCPEYNLPLSPVRCYSRPKCRSRMSTSLLMAKTRMLERRRELTLLESIIGNGDGNRSTPSNQERSRASFANRQSPISWLLSPSSGKTALTPLRSNTEREPTEAKVVQTGTHPPKHTRSLTSPSKVEKKQPVNLWSKPHQSQSLVPGEWTPSRHSLLRLLETFTSWWTTVCTTRLCSLRCCFADCLLDHIAIPSLLHRHWGRRVTHPMPIIDLFQLYRQDAVSFLGALHHAAHHLAKTQGVGEETPQTISFKYRSLKLLNERMSVVKGPYDDGTIIAVWLLANAEVCFATSPLLVYV